MKPPWGFQFEALRASNHTACRFAEKARFFRSLRAGRRCAAASRFYLFKAETLLMERRLFPTHRRGSARIPGVSFRECRRGGGNNCVCNEYALGRKARPRQADSRLFRARYIDSLQSGAGRLVLSPCKAMAYHPAADAFALSSVRCPRGVGALCFPRCDAGIFFAENPHASSLLAEGNPT